MVKPAGMMSNRYKLEEMPDLSGKVAVVTGGSRGIGEAAVSALVQKGCKVHIISATEDHQQEAVDNISKLAPNAPQLITTHAIDLGSLHKLIPLAKDLSSKLERLDILHLNAGVGVAPFGLTNDGLGNHYAINYLSHLVLADILTPKMIETSKKAQGDEKFGVRIVLESSELHRGAPSDVRCESVAEMNEDIGAARLYNRSKLFDIYLAKELVKHLPALNSENPVIVTSVHPGAVATEQQQGATEAYGLLGKALEVGSQLVFMTPEQGAESALWAATAPAVVERREEVHGGYFSEADGKAGTETEQAKNVALAKKLWDLSVKVLKEKAQYEVKL